MGGFLGVLTPLFHRYMDMDPASNAGPLDTAVRMLGTALFLATAGWLLNVPFSRSSYLRGLRRRRPVSNVGTGDTGGLGVVGAGVGRIVGGDEGRGVGRAVLNNSSVAAPHSGPQLPGPCLSGYTDPHCVALMRRCGASACGVPIMLPRIVKLWKGRSPPTRT